MSLIVSKIAKGVELPPGETLPGYSSTFPSSSSSFTSIQIMQQNRWGDGVLDYRVFHKIYLAVNAKATFQTIRRGYPNQGVPQMYYVYNTATIPIEMSMVDQRTYPMILAALKESESQFLELVFDGPKESWENLSILPPDGFRNRSKKIRLRIKDSPFLQLLYKDYRFNVAINVDGYVYRPDFRRGRHYPLSVDDSKMLELAIDEAGTSPEITIPMCPTLFGDHQLKGKFIVELQWNGPELSYYSFPVFKHMVDEVPKDVSIILGDGETYKCHSILIKAFSPVFTAMLESNMIEGQTSQIQLPDLDSPVLQAFLTFLNDGTLLEPFRNSDLCFKLFVLCNKYDVYVLEKATKVLLQAKPDQWLDTGTALELLCFVNNLPDSTELYEKAKTILRCRKDEVLGLKRYQELLEENPGFGEGIWGKADLIELE